MGDFARATTDIDLLAQLTSNEVENMKAIFTEIFNIQVDDALRYDLATVTVHEITEFKEYPGVNISVIAYLDKNKVLISIDIGFGDIISPKRVLMEFPVILNMEAPIIYAYSYQSVVAEKFEAIVSLGYANSRYKDFYDIYMLTISQSFNGEELKKALVKTFSHRKTRFEDIVAFEDDFSKDSQRQTRWNSFVKKKQAMVKVDLLEVINTIRYFLNPIVDAIDNGQGFDKIWNYEKKKG